MHKYVCNTSIIFFSFPPISTFSCIKGHLGTAHLFYCFLQLFLVLLFCRRLSYLVEEVTFKFFQGFKRVRTKPQCFSVSFPGGVVVKNPPTNAGDAEDSGLIPGLGRSPGGGNGNSLWYPSLPSLGGQRSLVDDTPWGCEVSDITEHAHTRILF